MKFSKIVTAAIAVVVLVLFANPVPAHGWERGGYHKKLRKRYDFPQEGWHKGPYLAGNAGAAWMCNDRHLVTGTAMGGCLDMILGLTLGWDIADWIGPMLQINYTTTIAYVGNGGDAVGPYPAGTFPVESARLHALDLSLFARATLPYFTRARWQWNNLKINPYAKLGATGYLLYVNSPTPANRLGAVGAGPALGFGVEFYIWEGGFFAFDFTESLIFQKPFLRTIAGTVTQVTEGGLKPQTKFLVLIGWHF